MTPVFPAELKFPLIHLVSGKVYTLVRADSLAQTEAALTDLVAACNGPQIYRWLFAERLAGAGFFRLRAALAVWASGWAARYQKF